MLGDSFQARHASVIQSAARPLYLSHTYAHMHNRVLCMAQNGPLGVTACGSKLDHSVQRQCLCYLIWQKWCLFLAFLMIWWTKICIMKFHKNTIYQNNLGEVHMLLPNWNSCYLDKRTMMVQSHKNLKKIMFGDFFKYYFFYCLERNRHTSNISLSYTLHYFLLTALSSFCELIFGPHNQGLEHSDTFD